MQSWKSNSILLLNEHYGFSGYLNWTSFFNRNIKQIKLSKQFPFLGLKKKAIDWKSSSKTPISGRRWGNSVGTRCGMGSFASINQCRSSTPEKSVFEARSARLQGRAVRLGPSRGEEYRSHTRSTLDPQAGGGPGTQCSWLHLHTPGRQGSLPPFTPVSDCGLQSLRSRAGSRKVRIIE